MQQSRMVFKSPMWTTPLPPPLAALGEGSHGSIRSGNYPPARLSSGWKSTATPCGYGEPRPSLGKMPDLDPQALTSDNVVGARWGHEPPIVQPIKRRSAPLNPGKMLVVSATPMWLRRISYKTLR